jgi:hypothetical protein
MIDSYESSEAVRVGTPVGDAFAHHRGERFAIGLLITARNSAHRSVARRLWKAAVRSWCRWWRSQQTLVHTEVAGSLMLPGQLTFDPSAGYLSH